MFFDGFEEPTVDVGGGIALRVRAGGQKGPFSRAVLQAGHGRRRGGAHAGPWATSGSPSSGTTAAATGEDNHADHLAAIRDPATVRALLEDYRAGLGVDRAADEADRAAGRRITCPTLILWSSRDDLEDLFGDPRAIWADWTTDLRGGGPIDSGHHMAEDAPDELAAALVPFLRM